MLLVTLLSFFLSFVAPGITNSFGGSSVSFNQPILGYVDGGKSVIMNVQAVSQPGVVGEGVGMVASIVGYLLDCSATPCNPIAGQ
jgi:hypothetical protein